MVPDQQRNRRMRRRQGLDLENGTEYFEVKKTTGKIR